MVFLITIVFAAHAYATVPFTIGFVVVNSHCHVAVLGVANICPMSTAVLKSLGYSFSHLFGRSKPIAFADCFSVIALIIAVSFRATIRNVFSKKVRRYCMCII